MPKQQISNAIARKPATAKKRNRVSQGTPTKAALKRAAATQAAAAKQARKRAWEIQCKQERWIADASYTQPAGTGLKVMHQTAAQRYFRLTKAELGSLRYIEFFNKHHKTAPLGKSYEYAELLTLVYRKFASLEGLPQDNAFIAGGKALFDA
ncbi:hypothetical protein FB451DRAFT_1361808 [Mycena latifolia]|nr:hypothetical protein FB451DRAFT_1361808 [Mycena latifolia]